jgi:hypothetical protein
LIAGDAILTAAHCLFEENDGTAFMDENTKKIIFGIDSTGNQYDIVDAVRVSSTSQHGFDLGIAFTATCLQSEPWVYLPCCDTPIKGQPATLLGWGIPADGQDPAETLMKGTVTFSPVCPDTEILAGMVEQQIVCLVDGLTGSTGPTPGDSGGPYVSATGEVLAVQASGNGFIATASDLGYWRPWILSALKSMSRCQGYQLQAGYCTIAQANTCLSPPLDCTRSVFGGPQVPITNCGSDGVVDTDVRVTTTLGTTTSGITTTTTTSTTTVTTTTTTPPLQIVTIRGRASGSFTFYTSFHAKPCGDMTLEDLPHMDLMIFSTLLSMIESSFSANAECIAVFGILIVNTVLDIGEFISHDWSLFAANTLAEFLDRDKDGLVDPGQPILYMRSGPLPFDDTLKGTWIPMLDASSLSRADSVFEMLGGGKPIGYAQFTNSMTVNNSMDRVSEELFKTWHQYGLARLHPTLFDVTSVPSCQTPGACLPRYGGTDYYCFLNTGCEYTGSLMMRCAKASSCVWYTRGLVCSAYGDSCGHSRCLTGGTCSDPACFGTGWLFNLMMAWSNQGDAMADNPGTVNGGNAFPTDKAEAETILVVDSACEDFLVVMRDPWYQILTEPLTYEYTMVPQGTATTTTTSTTMSKSTSTTTTVTTTTTRAWPKEPMNWVRKIRRITVTGMAGGTLEFDSVWSTKACNSLQHWELPHLEEQEVVLIRNKIFQKYGAYSLCISVFGILVICNIESVGAYENEPWCILEANIISELIDPNVDGYPDNLGIWENMRTGPGGHYLFLRSSSTLNSVQDEMAIDIGTTIEIKQERDFASNQYAEDSRRAMVEETFHTWFQAVSKTYPEEFAVPNTGCADPAILPNHSRRLIESEPIWDGRDRHLQTYPPCPYFSDRIVGCDWQTSVLTRCAWWAMCNFYTDGLCCREVGEWSSADFINGGYCANPSCAVTEFYFHLVMSWSGTGSGYAYDVGEVVTGGSTFPGDRGQVTTMFKRRGGDCKELLDIMENRSYYAQPRTLTLYYAPLELTRTTTTTTSTSTTSTSTSSTTISKTTTTLTFTTTSTTTSTLPHSLVTYIRGALDMTVDSPMTFIYDPFIQRACRRGLSDVAQCPEAWISLEMNKVYSRWLEQLDDDGDDDESLPWLSMLNMSRRWHGLNAIYPQAPRRLDRTYVQVEYGITVPPLQNPYRVAEAIGSDSTDNITRTMRLHVISAIGTSANLLVTGKSHPDLDVKNYTDYLADLIAQNTTRPPSTTRAPGNVQPTFERATSGTVVRRPAVCILMFLTIRSLSAVFYDS